MKLHDLIGEQVIIEGETDTVASVNQYDEFCDSNGHILFSSEELAAFLDDEDDAEFEFVQSLNDDQKRTLTEELRVKGYKQ